MTTILIVDDEPTLRDVLAELLRDEGYTVVTARDGREALAVFTREAPDLVLMDVMMPRLDGAATYHALRALPTGATVPIVLTSAAVTRGGLDEGIDGFLRKPFNMEDLLHLVERLVGAP